MSIGQAVVLASVGLTLIGAFLIFFRNRRALAIARRREMELRYAAERLTASESSRDTQEMERPLVAPDIPTALTTSCANGDCVLFAGTGLSASVGQPTWREALLGVLRRCQQERPDPVWNRLITEVGEEQYDLVADLIIEKLGSAAFYSYLRDVLLLGSSSTTSTVLREVQRLPFAGVISTLWDDLAADTFSSHRPNVLGPGSPTADYSEVLRKDAFFVLNAYGSLSDNSLLVTADSFNEYLDSHTVYARFLGSIFATRTVFFVGAGVAGIEDLLRGLGVRSSDGRRHYALVPWSTEAELRRERLLRRYNVELLLYPANPQHSSVTEFLAGLGRGVTARRRINDGKLRRASAPLTHLTLENIGPFENLELDFAQDWNVLLADNGCGKSTILRSIALALCGDEERAVRSGGRLLRAGESAGSIRVRFGEDSFETRLRRESSHVRVVPHNVTPVQTGEWLVLGFPAIRGISASHSRSAVGSPGRGPVVEDVLPLITSEVDTRLDDLTQWLLSSIYVESMESRISSLRRGGRRTVDRFFSVISQLGGGVELEFAGVDQETSEVLITTPDGTVSMRSLSQGMNSVLTWTGCLISRLEEVERMGSKRDGRTGLLLVDEIDAHLHPSWQRRIIDAARTQFPDVQFVATTHSPLVVGTMTDGNLWRLTREEGDAVHSERFSARFRGWRADQILTGPLFETDIRDPDTERLLEEYAKLAVLDDLSEKQETDLRRVAEQLKVRLPNPEQKEEARKARDLIQEASAAKLKQMPAEERDQVLEQLRIQVQEAIVGSRPER
jgi:predicted ATPase